MNIWPNHSLSKTFLGICLPGLIYCNSSFAQDDFFSNIAIDIDSDTSSSSLSLLGWVTEKVSYGLEQPDAFFSRTDPELNKIETSLFAQLDWQPAADLNLRFSGKAYHDAIYAIENDTPFSISERNEFRNRFEVKDFYLEKQFENDIYLKLGNQILAWGFAEYLRVTDIINTEDQYTFGQQDLEDLRLQVPATLLSVSLDEWVLDGVVTYRAGYHDLAPDGDEFDQFVLLRQGNAIIDRQSPDNPWEYFFRASTHFDNGDLQIVAGDFNNNQLTPGGISRPQSVSPIYHLSQQRMQALGIAANRASGSWLFFGELGMHFNSPLMPDNNSPLAQLDGWIEKDQLLGVAGIEYNGFTNTTVSLEVDSIEIMAHDENLLAKNNQLSLGTRVYWTGLNDRLELLSVWNKLADSQGYVTRVSAGYDWTDNLNFGLLWVDYSAEQTSPFYNFRNNDMLQLNLRISFQN